MIEPISAAPRHRRWTQDDITALRTALASGEPLARLAELLQRDTPDITQMMGRLRLKL